METKDRNLGLDVLRILSMIGIVGLHVIGQGGILVNVKLNTLNYAVAYFFEILLYSSVNIFAMLSGYLYCNKTNIKTKSIIDIILSAVVYCFAITGVFYALNLYNIRSSGIGILKESLFPMFQNTYWYITSYILVFFMIPYMNIFINAISKEKLKKMIVILTVLFCIITIFGLKDYFKIENGYSPFWLIYCYFIGAYIKKYVSCKNVKASKLIMIIFINVFIILLWNLVVANLTMNLLGYISYNGLIMQYNSPLVVINAICIFLLFERITIKGSGIANLITAISSTTLGVYIIHSHVLIYTKVLKDAFKNFAGENTIYLICVIAVGTLGIFCISSGIEYIRKKCFKWLHIDKFVKIAGDKLDKYM